jgi:CotH kinase protein
MDPRVVDDPAYRDRLRDAFKSLPIVSLVCGRDGLFGRRGLYLNTMPRGEQSEQACSAEMILPDGGTAFQIDCGVRIQGGMNRIPARSPKHSFRLVFRQQYGAGKLHYAVFPDSPVEKFDTLVLRADYNNSWVHWDPAARPRAQRTRDAWMKDSHRAMGWSAAHNRYVHLFLQGLYWGVYDFTERPDANFAAAYLGGTRKDYDVVNEFEAKDGTLDQFTVLHSLTGLVGRGPYQKLQQLLDVTNFIDYVLLNYYAGNQDWGENKNWYAIRRRTPAGLFQYFVWDGEQLMHDVRDNTVSQPYEMPFRMMEELKGNSEFRQAFAARVQKHFFGDGALTPGACAERWMKRAKEVDVAIIAESARWGYYRREIPYTRDREWAAEQQRLLKEYFPQRTEIVLKQLQAVGLYPKNSASTGMR